MFSIIVPSYARNAQVAALLDSLAEQSLHNFEVIIVDDCSPQPVTIEGNYPFRVSVHRNEKNAGPARSRNIGAAQATQEWLLFLDDDDRFDKDKCRILAQEILAHTQINFIYHPAQCVMVNEKFSYQTRPYADIGQLNKDNLLLANKVGGMPMLAIKKNLYFQVGGLSEQLLALEDYEFVLKLIACPDLVPHYVAQPLTRCFFHTKVASVSKNVDNTQSAISRIAEKYVQTPSQAKNFRINGFNMLAYPYLMSLSRKAAYYYFRVFLTAFNPKTLILAGITLISPKLAINMKRFI
ncbi:glycosyltransferase family 2 protein [Mesocricetibacter intestinalis]|uniref:glycosyltransferase family 2 protein n=1 Tax=Mesocricetibacter intestinalis TaxID=1521930 RepID=UPI0010619DD2|nr:glycosyltransferase [Mesocricetibacter intestinalis]